MVGVPHSELSSPRPRELLAVVGVRLGAPANREERDNAAMIYTHIIMLIVVNRLCLNLSLNKGSCLSPQAFPSSGYASYR